MAGRPRNEAPSPSALAPALLRLWAERGEDPRHVAAAAGLDPAIADRDDAPVTPSALAAMLDATCATFADPHFALTLPAVLRFRRYDALGLAARAASSRRAVIDLVVRYAPLLFPGLGAIASERGLAMTLEGHPRGLGLAVDEWLLASTAALLGRGAPFAFASVRLTSPRPASLAPLFVAMGTREIELGMPDTGFVVEDAPLAGDPMLLATADALAIAALEEAPGKGRFADVVGAKVEKLLGGERSAPQLPSCDAVAASLHMSGRTLQRRLDEEGTRFSEVLDARRERLAKRLLDETPLPLGEIAFRVGFSDLATFSRAFKRWTGVPPGAYRRARPSNDQGTKQ